jgi:uncharacterized membrane protein
MGENMNVPILLAVASLIAGGLVAFTSQFGVRNGADISSFILVDGIVFLSLAVLMMIVTKSSFVLTGRMTWWAIVCGMFASISVFTVLYALKLGGEGSIIFPIQSLQVVVAVVLAFLVFREPVTVTKLVGLSLGVGSLLILSR